MKYKILFLRKFAQENLCKYHRDEGSPTTDSVFYVRYVKLHQLIKVFICNKLNENTTLRKSLKRFCFKNQKNCYRIFYNLIIFYSIYSFTQKKIKAYQLLKKPMHSLKVFENFKKISTDQLMDKVRSFPDLRNENLMLSGNG